MKPLKYTKGQYIWNKHRLITWMEPFNSSVIIVSSGPLWVTYKNINRETKYKYSYTGIEQNYIIFGDPIYEN